MKLFYSELTANPAYYSFGYSVYAELEPGDRLEDCYEKGFLPFVGAREQDPHMLYMARGVRVRIQEFVERHYHNRVHRKVSKVLKQGIQTVVFKKEEHPNLGAVTDFFLIYFDFRFGNGAMSRERFEAILHGPFVSHIVEYRSGELLVGYTIEVQTATFTHVWHQAYAREYAGAHIGIALYLELLARMKREGKKFLYFGVTYGVHMEYKTNFQPLEFWNGQTWVADSHDTLKHLLREDGTRLLAYVDEWRALKGAYRASPYPFSSAVAELRYLALFAVQHRRLLGVYIILLGILSGLIFFAFFMS
jgi:arginyl-tRNA--protein-N-Asp/Glu arginylyltransferase